MKNLIRVKDMDVAVVVITVVMVMITILVVAVIAAAKKIKKIIGGTLMFIGRIYHKIAKLLIKFSLFSEKRKLQFVLEFLASILCLPFVIANRNLVVGVTRRQGRVLLATTRGLKTFCCSDSSVAIAIESGDNFFSSYRKLEKRQGSVSIGEAVALLKCNGFVPVR